MREAFDGVKKIPYPEEAASGRLEGRTALNFNSSQSLSVKLREIA
jgi:hypothetical protein